MHEGGRPLVASRTTDAAGPPRSEYIAGPSCSHYIAGPSRTTGTRDSCDRLSTSTPDRTSSTASACHPVRWSTRRLREAVWSSSRSSHRLPARRHCRRPASSGHVGKSSPQAHRPFHCAAHRHCGWRVRPVLASCPLPYLVPHLLPKYSWAVEIHRRCASRWAARRCWPPSQTRLVAGEAGASWGPGEKNARPWHTLLKFMKQCPLN